MGRWAVLLLALLVFLVIAMVVATGVSFVRRDSITWGHARGIYSVQLDRGTLVFFEYTRANLAQQRLTWTVLPPGTGERTGRWFLGFALQRSSDTNPLSFVGVPLWLPGVMAGFGSVYLAQCIRRARRTRRGLCPRCGYDVRASPLRCPECGTQRDEAVQPTACGQSTDG